ncbi:uncharacterized protein LOC109831568 isoform X2 [Asparagus officinalis]|uniref:uncharacterized protein LOC109831568 isoform X2 n=1 Tax=Asparagus officinalis TaxID=4686 RepID=UPI00098E81A1|nr:uncharacterized protein LOC109831568 isoform X2 [Asparagus officinalis]
MPKSRLIFILYFLRSLLPVEGLSLSYGPLGSLLHASAQGESSLSLSLSTPLRSPPPLKALSRSSIAVPQNPNQRFFYQKAKEEEGEEREKISKGEGFSIGKFHHAIEKQASTIGHILQTLI